MKPELILQYLNHTDLFKNLSSQQLETIAENVTVRYVAEGEVVHSKADTADTFYVVAVGEMELIMEGDEAINTIVGRVGPSGHFGETSLLANKPQSLTIRSLRLRMVVPPSLFCPRTTQSGRSNSSHNSWPHCQVIE